MVTFFSPYPSASDGQWGATVGSSVVRHEFFFQDGTLDGWDNLDADQPMDGLIGFDGTVECVNTGKVGPGGYAMVLKENTPGQWFNEPWYGGLHCPPFPVAYGQRVSITVFVSAEWPDASFDKKGLSDPPSLTFWYEGSTELYGNSYAYLAAPIFYNKALPAPHPKVWVGGAYDNYQYYTHQSSMVVLDPLVVEARFYIDLIAETQLNGGTLLKQGFRIGGAIVTVEDLVSFNGIGAL